MTIQQQYRKERERKGNERLRSGKRKRWRKVLSANWIRSQFHPHFTSSFFNIRNCFVHLLFACSLCLYFFGESARKMLVKLTTGVNFTHILQAVFPYKSVLCSSGFYVIFWQKETGSKTACKMLVKLSTDEDKTEESNKRKREERERKFPTIREKRNHENETKFEKFRKIA